MECKTVLEALCQSHEPYPWIRLEIRRREIKFDSSKVHGVISMLRYRQSVQK
jgi:hypothetical protein